MSDNHFFDGKNQYALCTDGLQLSDNVPEAFLVEHRMNAAPSFGGQRHDGRAFDTGQYFQNGIDLVGRYVHQHVFLFFSCLYGLYAEDQFVQNFLLLFAELLVWQ